MPPAIITITTLIIIIMSSIIIIIIGIISQFHHHHQHHHQHHLSHHPGMQLRPASSIVFWHFSGRSRWFDDHHHLCRHYPHLRHHHHQHYSHQCHNIFSSPPSLIPPPPSLSYSVRAHDFTHQRHVSCCTFHAALRLLRFTRYTLHDAQLLDARCVNTVRIIHCCSIFACLVCTVCCKHSFYLPYTHVDFSSADIDTNAASDFGAHSASVTYWGLESDATHKYVLPSELQRLRVAVFAAPCG